MAFYLGRGKGYLAVLAGLFAVKLLIMLFFEVDVIHFIAGWAFFYVSAAVAEMSSYFTFGELF